MSSTISTLWGSYSFDANGVCAPRCNARLGLCSLGQRHRRAKFSGQEHMTLTASPLSPRPVLRWTAHFVVLRSDAGVVYVASLLFDDSMMVLLAEHIQKLRPGARVISLKPIPTLETSGEGLGRAHMVEDVSDGGGGATERHRSLKLLHEGVFRMSWQMARVYIYLRL